MPPWRPAIERFREKVAVDERSGCWLWTASIQSNGYARFNDGVNVRGGHRFAYEVFIGPIPEGLVLDHLCRVRHCVNPAHLEPVTGPENVLRGAGMAELHRQRECKNGHPATPENVYRRRSTGRVVYCRPCRRERRAARC